MAPDAGEADDRRVADRRKNGVVDAGHERSVAAI
jgi:hypothetical protein